MDTATPIIDYPPRLLAIKAVNLSWSIAAETGCMARSTLKIVQWIFILAQGTCKAHIIFTVSHRNCRKSCLLATPTLMERGSDASETGIMARFADAIIKISPESNRTVREVPGAVWPLINKALLCLQDQPSDHHSQLLNYTPTSDPFRWIRWSLSVKLDDSKSFRHFYQLKSPIYK